MVEYGEKVFPMFSNDGHGKQKYSGDEAHRLPFP